MLAKLEQNSAPLTAANLARGGHAVMILPKASRLEAIRGLPFADALAAALERRRKKLGELTKSPIATDLPQGALAAWAVLDPAKPVFEQHTLLRKAMSLALAEKPEELAIAVFGTASERRRAAELAVYAAWVNGARLPERKKKSENTALRVMRLHGHRSPDGFARQSTVAQGNLLARELTVLPPNELTPANYRARVKQLARKRGWRHEEHDMKRLRKMGAGGRDRVARAASARSRPKSPASAWRGASRF